MFFFFYLGGTSFFPSFICARIKKIYHIAKNIAFLCGVAWRAKKFWPCTQMLEAKQNDMEGKSFLDTQGHYGLFATP